MRVVGVRKAGNDLQMGVVGDGLECVSGVHCAASIAELEAMAGECVEVAAVMEEVGLFQRGQ